MFCATQQGARWRAQLGNGRVGDGGAGEGGSRHGRRRRASRGRRGARNPPFFTWALPADVEGMATGDVWRAAEVGIRRESEVEEPKAEGCEEVAMEAVRVRLRESWARRCVEGLEAVFVAEDKEEKRVEEKWAARRTYAGGETYQPRSTKSGRMAASSVLAERSMEEAEAGAKGAEIGVGSGYQAEVAPLQEAERGCECTRRWCRCRAWTDAELMAEPLVLDWAPPLLLRHGTRPRCGRAIVYRRALCAQRARATSTTTASSPALLASETQTLLGLFLARRLPPCRPRVHTARFLL